MKRFFLYVLVATVGLVAGAILGALAGIAATTIFKTSNFEGYSGYLVFTAFMPLGAAIGLFAAPWMLAGRLRRKAKTEPAD